MLESLPLQKEALNLTSALASESSEAVNSLLSSLWQKMLPIVEIAGGVLIIYIIYIIISSISNYLLKKRVKRIDSNVKELAKKVDEILSLLKKTKKFQK